MPGACEGQKRVSDPLELELPIVLSYHVALLVIQDVSVFAHSHLLTA